MGDDDINLFEFYNCCPICGQEFKDCECECESEGAIVTGKQNQ